MSYSTICPNCFQEGIRANFGDNLEAEKKFHSQKWCKCGYNSPDEMMIDQDMGFTDPFWFRIAIRFIERYHLSINQGRIQTNEELVRFFLKLLKSTANGFRKSIELVDKKEDYQYEIVFEGKTKEKPQTNIIQKDFLSIVSLPFSNFQGVKYLAIGIFIGLIIGKLI